MQKMYKPARIGLIFVILAVSLSIYVSALYGMQIYTAGPAEADLYPLKTMQREIALPAARGNIYDRNGVLLASGKPVYNIVINWDEWNTIPYNERSLVIRELVFTAMDEGIKYNDSFPITRGAPFTYISNMTGEQRRRLNEYIKFFNLDPDISASDLLAKMRSNYKIDFTTRTTEARLIIGVRYEIEIRAIMTNLSAYTFANDVSTDFISILEERRLPAVNIESNYIREYHTSNAAHILGYIGSIPREQREKYKELGYPMDAIVGLVGAEYAFEDILRGINGSQIVRTDQNGAVMQITPVKDPIPGEHVYLTLDMGLQVASEDALRSHIESGNIEREEDAAKITGGAVVVLDVQTGELLAAASFPTFNRFTLAQDYTAHATNPNWPMFNRALQGQYYPGSTFKMITGLTALRNGIINRYSEIDDVGEFDKYKDTPGGGFTVSCPIFQVSRVGHGRLNIIGALTVSCNYFFSSVADWFPGGSLAGAELIAKTAQEFGLGRSTGIEIYENTGILGTPENKERLRGGEKWYTADTIMIAFGQGMNEFSPLQLADYAATIANGGTLHSLTVLRRILSADMSEMVFTHEPVILNVFESPEFIEIIQEGMLSVSRRGTAKSVFGDYPINVASKTGTVEIEEQEKNNGVFVCYAPAENPQIAISIVIEKGGSGSAVMDIAKAIFDYYFGMQVTAFAVPFGELIP